jgi:hypothetical protein
MTNPQWLGGEEWIGRVVGLVLVVAGLLAVSVVDVDGDPTTTNVATVVLVGEVAVADEDAIRRTPSDSAAPVGAKLLMRLRRAVNRWLGEGRYRWIARVQPIRGP